MVAFVCICHKGELELKTAFLISTLRKRINNSFKIYIAIPEENNFCSSPTENFLSFCNLYNVEYYRFQNPYLNQISDVKAGDMISNKIFALNHEFIEDYIIFLDSDTMILRSFDPNEMTEGTHDICLKPANRNNVVNWDSIYNTAGIIPPQETVKSAINEEIMPPYFNSGVIIFKSGIRHNIYTLWKKYFILLSEEEPKGNLIYPIYHRDQIALSLAIIASGIVYSILDEKFNFPVRGKKINKKHLPYIVHYHNPYSLYFEPLLNKEFRNFLRQNSKFLESGLPIWTYLFNSTFLKEYETAFIEYLRYKKYKLSQIFLRWKKFFIVISH